MPLAQCEKDKHPVKLVEVVKVKYHSINKEVHIIGELKAKKFSNIYAKVDGKIDLIEELQNNTIVKDQTLAILENNLIKAQVELAKKSEILAKKKFNRLSELAKLGSISKEKLDQAKEAWLKTKLELNDKIIELNKTIIKAPFSGKLSHFQVTEGAIVKQGELLAVAYDTSKYTVELPSSLALLQKIRKGQKITIDEKYSGEITDIQQSLSKDNRMGIVYANLANCHGCFVGQMVEARISIGNKNKVLTVPNEAIFLHKGREHVIKIVDNKAIRTPITIGINDQKYTEIIDGLNNTEIIVKSNPVRLHHNESIEIYEPS